MSPSNSNQGAVKDYELRTSYDLSTLTCGELILLISQINNGLEQVAEKLKLDRLGWFFKEKLRWFIEIN